jgi:hypothetical protein
MKFTEFYTGDDSLTPVQKEWNAKIARGEGDYCEPTICKVCGEYLVMTR